MAIVRHFFICFTVTLALTASTTGLFALPHMRINFPATRLFLRTQFIIDLLGCVVTIAYWITFNLDIPTSLLSGSAFSYLWTSYCTTAMIEQISSQNLILLSIDRYWAVIRFRTYPRDSKFYRFGLVVISVLTGIVSVVSTPILSYYGTHVNLIGSSKLTICMKIQAIYALLVGLLIPGFVISALQIKILKILWQMRRFPAMSESSTNTELRSNQKVIDQSTKGISVGIVFMLVTFILVRSIYLSMYVMKMFGSEDLYPFKEWKNDGIFSYSISFSINPTVMIFTSPGAREWLLEKFVSVVEPIRRWCHLSSRNPASQ